MAQPRLQFAMAKDGLLPPIFSRIDPSGNLYFGTLISGSLCVIVATCVPFVYLNDLISAGILLAFSMTDASVVLLRLDSPISSLEVSSTSSSSSGREKGGRRKSFLLEKLLMVFNVLSMTVGFSLQNGSDESLTWKILGGVQVMTLVGIAMYIGMYCPKKSRIAEQENEEEEEEEDDEGYFETPFVPYLPLLGQFLNCYLIGQLEVEGLLLLLGYTGLSIGFYFVYGAKHSFGNTIGWSGDHNIMDADDEVEERNHDDRRGENDPNSSTSVGSCSGTPSESESVIGSGESCKDQEIPMVAVQDPVHEEMTSLLDRKEEEEDDAGGRGGNDGDHNDVNHDDDDLSVDADDDDDDDGISMGSATTEQINF